MINRKQQKEIEVKYTAKYPSENLSEWKEWHNDIPNIINENNYKSGVEVGVAYGGHSISILDKTNVRKLYGIDPYLNYSEYRGDSRNLEQEKQDDLHLMVKGRMSFYGDRFELIRKLSNECYQLFEDASLDFVYIDGNHFEKFVKQDIENWFPKIRPGGILSGHDYNHPNFPHVSQCVDHFFNSKDLGVNVLSHHNWYVEK